MKKILFVILLGIISFGCKGQEVNFNFDIDFEKCIVIDSTFNDFSEWAKLKEIEDTLINDIYFDWQTYYEENWKNNKGIVFFPQYVTLTQNNKFNKCNKNDYFYFSDTLSFFYYKDMFFISHKTIGANIYLFNGDFEVYKNGVKIDYLEDIKIGLEPNNNLNCYELYIVCHSLGFTTDTKIEDFNYFHKFINKKNL